MPVEVVGGIAVSLLGRPRFSRDIDALVFARRSRVLLLRHGPSQIDIDVILSGLPFDRAIVASGQPRSLSRD